MASWMDIPGVSQDYFWDKNWIVLQFNWMLHSLFCGSGWDNSVTTGSRDQVWVQVWAPAGHLAITLERLVQDSNKGFELGLAWAQLWQTCKQSLVFFSVFLGCFTQQLYNKSRRDLSFLYSSTFLQVASCHLSQYTQSTDSTLILL